MKLALRHLFVLATFLVSVLLYVDPACISAAAAFGWLLINPQPPVEATS